MIKKEIYPRDLTEMNPENMFLQTASVFGAMWTVRAALLRLLAALDLQMILHVPQPAVFLAALRTLEGARFLVEVIARSFGSLWIRVSRTARHFVPIGLFTLIPTVTWPSCYHSCKKIKRAG